MKYNLALMLILVIQNVFSQSIDINKYKIDAMKIKTISGNTIRFVNDLPIDTLPLYKVFYDSTGNVIEKHYNYLKNKSDNLLFFSNTFAQTTNKSLEISHLTDNFYIYTTYQDYRGTPFPANGMYLITEIGAVLFDTPWDTTQFQHLLDTIKARHNKEVIMVIATHSHDDRTAGLEYYAQKGIKTYTTALTDSISQIKGEKRAELLIYGDTAFTVGDYMFEVYYPGPGHTLDNIVIWFPQHKILYGGCFVKSTDSKSLGNLSDADVKSWPASVHNVLNKFDQPEFVIPGHQSWNDNKSLEYTLKLLEK